jgi:hypothetical protein
VKSDLNLIELLIIIINLEKLNELLEKTDSLSRREFSLMEYLKNSDIKDFKYLKD